ncbi:hypothetical protein Hamer_G006190 [Homarus americanus]|uniref:Uncharacterized protein n=1 Tax=Homarus americanus TaxID=6706 RepID=A0A8J5JHR1_HOMAM|nr:hypothetical protein Hamer_G006190 [Homarus americanus]
MAGNVDQFQETNDVHFLYQCNKEELIEVASRYEISLRLYIKSDMHRELIDELVSLSILEEVEGDDNISGGYKQISEQVVMEKLKLELKFKKMQLEVEREKEKIQADKEVQLRKLEVEERTSIRRGNGDKDNRVCHLPEFVEEEAEGFFIKL